MCYVSLSPAFQTVAPWLPPPRAKQLRSASPPRRLLTTCGPSMWLWPSTSWHMRSSRRAERWQIWRRSSPSSPGYPILQVREYIKYKLAHAQQSTSRALADLEKILPVLTRISDPAGHRVPTLSTPVLWSRSNLDRLRFMWPTPVPDKKLNPLVT